MSETVTGQDRLEAYIRILRKNHPEINDYLDREIACALERYSQLKGIKGWSNIQLDGFVEWAIEPRIITLSKESQ